MDNQKVTLERRDNIGIVTINNPPVNALDEQVISELEEVFCGAKKGELDGLRALIITGAGEKFFVAGADISAFPDLRRETGIALVKRGTDIYDRIASFRCPVICAVNGIVLGGGLELALACDIRIFAKTAKVGLPEVGLGIYPGYGGTQRLPRLVGSGLAKQMIFTGAHFTAEDAYRMGLCETLAEPGTVRDAAIALAEKIASNAPVAIAKAKQVIDQGLDLNIRDAIALENSVFGELCETSDKNEGTAAFLEKRKPVFNGK